ncbi:hypothetical protein WISP_56991 [Willisornis vidua]|uniref:Uncharacterized protein n=1 Tax=Willisornis vidua TaxID=1566151 RepID=A0ABQ9DBQ9_9PASS|nr:hypothetical protein WISP_56991 [Willisornis vidua]
MVEGVLQALEQRFPYTVLKTMVHQAVSLQPMAVHNGAEIHLQPVRNPIRPGRYAMEETAEKVPGRICDPAEDPYWSSLFQKD